MSKFALSLLWGGNGRVCGFGLPSVSFWSGPARVARHAGRARGSVGMKAGVVLKTSGQSAVYDGVISDAIHGAPTAGVV